MLGMNSICCQFLPVAKVDMMLFDDIYIPLNQCNVRCQHIALYTSFCIKTANVVWQQIGENQYYSQHLIYHPMLLVPRASA